MDSELQASNNNLIERKKTGSKLPNGTVTRNFFQIEDLQDDYEETGSPTKLMQHKKQEGNDSPLKQSKRRFKNIKLKPIGSANPHVIQLSTTNKKNEENPEKKEEKPETNTKNQKGKLHFDISSSQQEQPDPVIQKSQNKVEQKKELQQSHHYLQQHVDSPQQQLQQEQDAQDEIHSEQLQPRNSQVVDVNRSLNLSHGVTFIMRRDKQWLNKIWPQFNVNMQVNNQYCFSAKLTGNNKQTTFTICSSMDSFVENGPKYLGKVKANFMGNIINIFGPGYNPSDFKNKKTPIRQLLATVQYETNFFGSTRPRNFKVYALRNKVSYYDDLTGPSRGEDQVPLNELIDLGDNKRKIIVMQNRKPSWNQSIKGYMLYFGGRVKKPSIKNFILEDVDNPANARLIFGKLDEDQFRLDIGAPLSPLVGFGVALSTFGGKIGCQ